MKRLCCGLLLFLKLSATQVYGQTDLDPFSDNALVHEQVLLKPRRGYPELLPYTESSNSIVSMHIPTIENPPSSLIDMPRVLKVIPELVHTKEGDIIYNITKWFPLDKMRADKLKKEKRWVYYNQTSGYIIANADRFLQSSIHDYVKGNLAKHGISYKFSMVYLEIDDSLPLEIKAIGKSDYKTLISCSGVCQSGEKLLWRYDDTELEVNLSSVRNGTNYTGIVLWLEDQLRVNCDFCHNTNEWLLFECGISSVG